MSQIHWRNFVKHLIQTTVITQAVYMNYMYKFFNAMGKNIIFYLNLLAYSAKQNWKSHSHWDSHTFSISTAQFCVQFQLKLHKMFAAYFRFMNMDA